MKIESIKEQKMVKKASANVQKNKHNYSENSTKSLNPAKTTSGIWCIIKPLIM